MKFKSFKTWDSIRKYLDKQVCDDVIKDLLKAGKDKFDSMGDKLLSFTVIQNKDQIDELNKITKVDMTKKSDVDIVTRLGKTPDFDIFYGASTVIMISIKDRSKAFGDLCGDVIHNIVSAAKDLGLSAHWNSFVKYHFSDGVKKEEKQSLNIPDDYIPHYVISLGYAK